MTKVLMNECPTCGAGTKYDLLEFDFLPEGFPKVEGCPACINEARDAAEYVEWPEIGKEYVEGEGPVIGVEYSYGKEAWIWIGADHWGRLEML